MDERLLTGHTRQLLQTSPGPRRSLFSRALWLARYRPAHLYQLGRGYLLFRAAHALRSLGIAPLNGVTLGENVRLQRNRSLTAERPLASIEIGDHSIIYEDARIEAYGEGRITIGACSIVGAARIMARFGIAIGDRFLSSWNVLIQDYDSHPVSAAERGNQVRKLVADFRPQLGGRELPQSWPVPDFKGQPIIIGHDVWIGANCTILKGARIGDGSIVAAGSVVIRGEYPARSLLAGNPAVVVKSLPE